MNDKIKTFLGGAIPGYFTGLLFLFGNPSTGKYAVITAILKVGMAFALAMATGMGTLVAKDIYHKVKTNIQKRQIKKDAKKEESKRRRA